jgi:hypothetical protein
MVIISFPSEPGKETVERCQMVNSAGASNMIGGAGSVGGACSVRRPQPDMSASINAKITKCFMFSFLPNDENHPQEMAQLFLVGCILLFGI